MKCPKCGQDVADNSRFCSFCGNSVTINCPVCGLASDALNKYCPGCGAELSRAEPGLTLSRALAWREQFKRMGWWDDPFETLGKLQSSHLWDNHERSQKRGQIFTALISRESFAEIDSKSEPWIFCCHVCLKDWHIYSVSKDGQDPGRFDVSPLFVITTRCRLVIVDTKAAQLYSWLFGDIKTIEQKDNGSIYVGMKTQENLQFAFKTKGPGLFERTYLLGVAASGSKLTASHLIAASNIEAANSMKADFLTIVAEFFSDVLSVGRSD